MLIVAIDTSGQAGGITLAEDDAHSFRVLESAPISGGTFSAQLVPVLASMLQRHNLQPSDLGGFAAVSGPGSFTGLRVGLSAVKGLAEVLQRPIAVVSLLEALATQADAQGTVAAALDASRNEIFLGLYTVSGDKAVMLEEKLCPGEEFVSAIRSASPVAVVTSDSRIAELAAGFNTRVRQVSHPSTELVATIGLKKLLAGETISVEELDANYIRRSDAEVALSKPAGSEVPRT
jgi:tRNA threonylcarbamoyladenosine biosynthesis protein TsaB